MDEDGNASLLEEAGKVTAFENDSTKKSIHTLHFCFLVHGWKGLRADFNYMETTLRDESLAYINQNSSDFVDEEFIVYNCKSNENNTDDGIVAGGERVAQETLEFIKDKINKYTNVKHVTLSFVGASLGGLYARHAFAIIQENLIPTGEEVSPYFMILRDNGQSKNTDEDKVRIHFNCFISVVSPFIGLARNSFIPLPRIVQAGLCRILGPTLDDVFNFTDNIYNLCTSSRFLNPLSSFHKRVAYANVYFTDLSVPTETSGFLHKKSNHPHHFVEERIDSDDKFDHNFMVATLTTEKKRTFVSSTEKQLDTEETCDSVIDYYNDETMLKMCENLDVLGWKKVFIDTRNAIRIGVNLNLLSNMAQKIQNLISDKFSPCTTSDLMVQLENERVVKSKDLAQVLSSPFAPSNFVLSAPMGHKTIGACNRNAKDEFMFRGGRKIASTMVKGWISEIFTWKIDQKS